MTDRDVVERVAALFGTAVMENDKGRYRTEFGATVKGKGAVTFMRDIEPLMGKGGTRRLTPPRSSTVVFMRRHLPDLGEIASRRCHPSIRHRGCPQLSCTGSPDGSRARAAFKPLLLPNQPALALQVARPKTNFHLKGH
jgi:hypothetical protein